MKRRKFAFAAEPLKKEDGTVCATFAEDGGLILDVVLFSNQRNRNKYFFDITQLLSYKTRLETVLINRNHDGKYYGIEGAKFIDIDIRFVDGRTEILGKMEIKAEDLIRDKDLMSGISIELSADYGDVFEFADGQGFYMQNFDFEGCAILFGVLAGNGDSRIENIATFEMAGDEPPSTINTNMTEEQMNELKSHVTDQLATFASNIEAKLEAKFHTVEPQDSPEQGVEETPAEDAAPTGEGAEVVTEEAPVEENPEVIAIENALDKAAENSKIKAQHNKEELVTEPAATENAATPELDAKKAINNNLKNIL